MPENVLTVIGSPLAATATAAAVDAAVACLRQLGALIEGRAWLARDRACDIFFSELDPDQADAAARNGIASALGPTSVDLIAQPVLGRRKLLLLADMESTIIANEMLDELADLLGLKAEVALITRRAMNDEIDFAVALRERVALLKGLPESALTEAGQRIRVTPGAGELVATMRANGAYAALVSGGFRVYSARIRDALGFDLDVANELIIADGKLAGTVAEPILGRDAKLQTLKRLAVERTLPLAATLAVGDGANDIAMIEAAGLGIAYHARPAVAARVRRSIEHNDLTALLYAQGYSEAEIIGR
ncbi:MAG TPA: phosphoserine phosphatase SerB [Stellaceae bacterium]|nr:phosphoserine phosphatase SerB [Stellaceae bacterium]